MATRSGSSLCSIPKELKKLIKKYSIPARYDKGGNFINGLFSYSENGEAVLDLFINKDGKRNGLYTGMLPLSRMRVEVYYKDDQRNGTTKLWHPNGKLADYFNYKNGQLDGIQERYYSDGYLMERFLYSDGVRIK